MFALIKRYRELIVVSALLLYPFVAFLARGTSARSPNFIDRGVIAITSPLQRGLGWTIDSAIEGWKGYVALRGVRDQNTALAKENTELRERLQQLSEAEKENGRLRSLLAYTEANLGVEITARVIGVNPDSRLLSVRIDRGTNDGVQVGAAVITADGVVGQVIRAIGGYADVMLVKDPSSRLAARVQRSRARGTAAGVAGDENLVLENVLRVEDVKEGDLILTAGTDGVFPPGIAVGTVSQVQKKGTGMFQSAEVVPSVDVTRLEEVLVLPRVDLNQALSAETQKETTP